MNNKQVDPKTVPMAEREDKTPGFFETAILRFGVAGIIAFTVLMSFVLSMALMFSIAAFFATPSESYWLTGIISVSVSLPVSYFVIRLLQRAMQAEELAQFYKAASLEAEEHLQLLKRKIPWCPSCNKIQSDDGQWQALASEYEKESESLLKDVLCDPCLQENYPEEFEMILEKRKVRA